MRKILILPALLLTAATAPPTAEDIGPEPSPPEARAMIEQAIRGRLFDPDSAKFEWPYAFTGGGLKGLFSKRHAGWITCGLVNAKNRMGGYTGQSYFEVVIHNGAIDMLDIGEDQELDLVGMSCQKLIKDGFLHPAEVAPPASAAGVSPATPQPTEEQMMGGARAAAAKGGLGISFVPSSVGAILMAVAPGSRADKSGLKAGETIEAINGIPVKSMDQATIAAILHSDAASLTVKVVGVGNIEIVR